MGKGTSIVLGRTGLYRVQVRVCYLVLMGTAGTTLGLAPSGQIWASAVRTKPRGLGSGLSWGCHGSFSEYMEAIGHGYQLHCTCATSPYLVVLEILGTYRAQHCLTEIYSVMVLHAKEL